MPKSYQLKYKRFGKIVRSKEVYDNFYKAKTICTRMNRVFKEAYGKKRFVKCRVVHAEKRK